MNFFGKANRYFGNSNGLVQRLVAGWQVGGFLTRDPAAMTVYRAATRFRTFVRLPPTCNGCPRSLGQVFQDPAAPHLLLQYDQQRAQFSTPAPGDFSNTGRNYFRGPSFFDIARLSPKRSISTERYYLQIRADASNLTNHPSFGFPTLTLTSSTFGRIRSSTDSASRKIQLGVKFYF